MLIQFVAKNAFNLGQYKKWKWPYVISKLFVTFYIIFCMFQLYPANIQHLDDPLPANYEKLLFLIWWLRMTELWLLLHRNRFRTTGAEECTQALLNIAASPRRKNPLISVSTNCSHCERLVRNQNNSYIRFYIFTIVYRFPNGKVYTSNQNFLDSTKNKKDFRYIRDIWVVLRCVLRPAPGSEPGSRPVIGWKGSHDLSLLSTCSWPLITRGRPTVEVRHFW